MNTALHSLAQRVRAGGPCSWDEPLSVRTVGGRSARPLAGAAGILRPGPKRQVGGEAACAGGAGGAGDWGTGAGE